MTYTDKSPESARRFLNGAVSGTLTGKHKMQSASKLHFGLMVASNPGSAGVYPLY
jgi:hypothetical protein